MIDGPRGMLRGEIRNKRNRKINNLIFTSPGFSHPYFSLIKKDHGKIWGIRGEIKR